MLAPCFITAIGRDGNGRRSGRPTKIGHQLAGVLASAIVLLAIGASCTPSAPAWAQTGLQAASGHTLGSRGQVGLPNFVAESHRMLKTQHERMIQIATQILGKSQDRLRRQDQLINQRVATFSAQAEYENARLARELAEISVVEYDAGISVQDEATLEGEVHLAKSDLQRQRTRIDGIKDQIASIQRASKGLAVELAIEFRYGDSLIDVQRKERKAQLDLQKLESKLSMLKQYTKPIRVLELKAEVEAARANELAKKAAHEKEAAKERVIAASIREDDARPPADAGRALALLDKAISVEEQVRAKLNEAKKDPKAGLVPQKEIRDLMGLLQATIDEADAARSALALERVKTRIHRAAIHAGARTK